MRDKTVSREWLAGLLLAAVLAGCASSPEKKVASDLGEYGALYDGKSGVVFGTELPVTSASEAVQWGDLAVASGDLDKALFDYIRALQFEDGNAEALYKIGLIHSIRGNDRLAELAFRWSLKKDPRNVGALSGLGVLLLKRREYAESRKYLEMAVGIDERLARAHNALGVIADLKGHYAEAQGHYSKALAVAPKSAALMNNLGYSRYLGGNWKGAAAAYRQALLIDPNYDLAWRNLALVYARQQRYTEALDALNKIEDSPKAYNDVGYVAMVGGKLKDAQSFFEEAKRLSPEFYELADTNARRVRIMRGLAAAP